MWALLLAALAWSADGDLESRLLGTDPETDLPSYGPELPAYGPEPGPVVVATATTTPREDAPREEPRIAPPERKADRSDPAAWLDELQGAESIGDRQGTPGLPWWVPLVALAGAGAFYWSRTQKAAGPSAKEIPEIRIRTRAQLGGGAGVALVEVKDGERTRRLLLGTGDKHPVLLTELGSARDALPEPLPRRERPVSRRSERLSDALAGKTKKKARAPEPASDWLGDATPDLGPRKAAARVLIDEALAERRGPRAV